MKLVEPKVVNLRDVHETAIVHPNARLSIKSGFRKGSQFYIFSENDHPFINEFRKIIYLTSFSKTLSIDFTLKFPFQKDLIQLQQTSDPPQRLNAHRLWQLLWHGRYFL